MMTNFEIIKKVLVSFDIDPNTVDNHLSRYVDYEEKIKTYRDVWEIIKLGRFLLWDLAGIRRQIERNKHILLSDDKVLIVKPIKHNKDLK